MCFSAVAWNIWHPVCQMRVIWNLFQTRGHQTTCHPGESWSVVDTRQCNWWAETTIVVRHQLTVVWQIRQCSGVKCLVRQRSQLELDTIDVISAERMWCVHADLSVWSAWRQHSKLSADLDKVVGDAVQNRVTVVQATRYERQGQYICSIQRQWL